MKCYTGDNAGLNIFANNHNNYGLISITLLKDDNLAVSFTNDIPSASEEFLNRVSELQSSLDGARANIQELKNVISELTGKTFD